MGKQSFVSTTGSFACKMQFFTEIGGQFPVIVGRKQTTKKTSKLKIKARLKPLP